MSRLSVCSQVRLLLRKFIFRVWCIFPLLQCEIDRLWWPCFLVTAESIYSYLVTVAFLLSVFSCWLTADVPMCQILLLTGVFCFLHHYMVALKYCE